MEQNPTSPHRIGVMVDLPGFPGLTDMFPLGVKFALDEAYESGLIDRPVEMVNNEHIGQPWGDGSASRNAYRELVEEHQVLAISGPM